MTSLGHDVILCSARPPEGPFPVEVRPLDEIAQVGTDVIYERYSLGHLGGLHQARRLGVPFVLEVNAPLLDEAAAHRPGSVGPNDLRVEAVLFAEADLVISVSSGLSAWIAERREGPILTVANGFEPSWFTQQQPRRTAQPARFPLAFLGHPKPWHGADRLIEILVALNAIGRHVDALVIGGGRGTDELRRRAGQVGVASQLHITGALPPDQASARLAECAIGLAPYRRHARFYFCPLKVVDYMAAGLPVVASDQGDIRRLVGRSGLVVDPDDDAALITAVTSLLDSPEIGDAMGRTGRARAHRSMTWTHIAKTTCEAIASIRASSPSPFPAFHEVGT